MVVANTTTTIDGKRRGEGRTGLCCGVFLRRWKERGQQWYSCTYMTMEESMIACGGSQQKRSRVHTTDWCCCKGWRSSVNVSGGGEALQMVVVEFVFFSFFVSFYFWFFTFSTHLCCWCCTDCVVIVICILNELKVLWLWWMEEVWVEFLEMNGGSDEKSFEGWYGNVMIRVLKDDVGMVMICSETITHERGKELFLFAWNFSCVSYCLKIVLYLY